ncbi:MAG: pantetheine-phosphate adenylyltransferase [Candidatus Levybacteria bacterium]|nr:pantetheine-phosphate adenylyltransferase [Candidatus Levybacteria bacterium]
MRRFRLAACGGTFDHFHKGHRDFLQFALKNADKLIIGITSDKYPDNKREEIESFSSRKLSVYSFLERESAINKTEIISIDDVYGPTISKAVPIEAIIVSEQTQKGAELINNYRQELGLLSLKMLVSPMTKAQDNGIISSLRIRRGEIDREGELYMHPSLLFQKRVLPEDLRQKLKKPLGVLLRGKSILRGLDPQKTITVGDVVTKTCNESSFGQKISVIDFYVGREKKFSNILELGFLGKEEIMSVTNPAGSLTPELFKAARDIFLTEKDKRCVVKVEGEEDLAVLPFLLAAPLSFTILYGQPNVGVVRVNVSEEMKNVARNIVSQFIS